MTTPYEVKILDKILLVDLSGIRLWTARRKLKPSMLEGTIPPAVLASLGSMRVIDPEKLKPFEKIKRKAVALLESKGVKFLGGYAVPDSLIHEIVDELNVLKDEFYEYKTYFMSLYDEFVDEWINNGWEKSEWRDAIRSSATPKAGVDAGLQFGFAACRVAADKDDKLNQLLDGEVRGLSDQLLADTAAEAEELLATGLASRGQVDQRTLGTIRRMHSKLKGLMFLSSEVRQLTRYMGDLLDQLPATGVVNGNLYSQVVTLVSALSDEGSIKRLIKGLNASADSDESTPVTAAPAPAVVVAQPEPEATVAPAVQAVVSQATQVEPETKSLVEESAQVAESEPEPAAECLQFPTFAQMQEKEEQREVRSQQIRRKNPFLF